MAYFLVSNDNFVKNRHMSLRRLSFALGAIKAGALGPLFFWVG